MSPKAPTTVLPPAKAAKAAAKGSYTWEEVSRHNTEKSAWVIVRGRVYDVTEFLDRHPGGREMLLLAAGRECTDLFAMYHALSEKPEKFLNAYDIGSAVGAPEFTPFAPDTGFWDDVRGRVKDYFARTGLDPKGGVVGGTLRMIPVWALFLTCFLIINRQLLPDATFSVRLLAAIIFGVCQVLPLLHVMHDASHTSIGRSEGWWKFFGRLTLDWVAGASMLSWHHQHVVGHHVYTNVFLQDPDLPHGTVGDVRRLVPQQVWTAVYKWQHIYMPGLLYGLLAIKVRIDDIYCTWVTRLSGHIRVNHYNDMVSRMVLVKAVWLAWRIILPLAVWKQGVSAAEFWTLFLVAELTSGYWLAWNFQVSHLSTGLSFSEGGKGATLPESWAVTQVKTALDYGHDNPAMTFLCGALNYQIEHHLFPGISQYHYPAIARLVQSACAAHGIPYRYERSFFGAFRAHVQHLWEMGQRGEAAHID